MPSTALIFLNRALPMTKPDTFPFLGDVFFGAMPAFLAQLVSPRTGDKTIIPSKMEMVRAAGLEPAQSFRTEGFSYQLRLSPPCPGACAQARLWSGLYLHHWCVRAFRCCPSSLYTFAPTVRSGRLARDCHVKGFPEFEQFCSLGFPKRTQSFKSLASTSFATPAYSQEIRYLARLPEKWNWDSVRPERVPSFSERARQSKASMPTPAAALGNLNVVRLTKVRCR